MMLVYKLRMLLIVDFQPSEKDQVRMVMKNVLPTYGGQLAPIPLKIFVDLYDAGVQVEDAINSGLVEKNDAKP